MGYLHRCCGAICRRQNGGKVNCSRAAKSLRLRKVLILVGSCGLALTPKQAFAQRGVTLPHQAPANSASSGISGFFDTNVADDNYFVSDFPTLSVDYGVGRDVTIGTSLLTVVSVVQALSDKNEKPFQFFNGKLRYRLLSNSSWSAALTGYYAYLRAKGSQTVSTTQIPAATLNVARELQNGSAGVSVLVAEVRSLTGAENSAGFTRADKLYRILSGWWRPSLTANSEFEILASLCTPTRSVELSNFSRVDISQSCFSDKMYSGFVRGLVSWRSSQTWLWSAGVIWTPGSTTKFIPVFAAHHVAEFFSRGSANTIQPTTDTSHEE
ncbi:MAG: hypothetical protein RL189_1691 [Pseudomonadota bacterium]